MRRFLERAISWKLYVDTMLCRFWRSWFMHDMHTDAGAGFFEKLAMGRRGYGKSAHMYTIVYYTRVGGRERWKAAERRRGRSHTERGNEERRTRVRERAEANGT
jgi:hypothetical protein